jgi:uncharacterized phage-like protein YoqJ
MNPAEKNTTLTKFEQYIIDKVDEKNAIINEIRKGNKDVFTQKNKKLVQPISNK